MTASTKGTVYLVGAGPGDPTLLTLRAKNLLENADIVFYDYLIHPQVLTWIRPDAQRVYVGKKGGAVNLTHQAHIHHLMIDAARQHRCVVRLKGGDPFIFGRGGEEAAALADAGIPFEVVPGVTSAIAAPAYAGIPLTHRDFAATVAFATGHEDPQHSENLAHLDRTSADTWIVLMGMGNLAAIVSRFLENGWPQDTPIALIQWGTYARQKTVTGTLQDILVRVEAACLKPPVVMVIGRVVLLRHKLNWFETRPLFGKKIVVTRAAEQAEDFAGLLRHAGADPILLPVIQIRPVSDWGRLDAALNHLDRYQAIIFTSVNGVRFFRERLLTRHIDIRNLHGKALYAIGPKTAERLWEWGLKVERLPEVFQAEGIVSMLLQIGISGKKFLIPRAKEAREILPDEIRRLGGEVDVVPVYETIGASPPSEVDLSEMDMITFASPSSVRYFMSGVGQPLREGCQRGKAPLIACIGPITAECARSMGLAVTVIPKQYTIAALAEAIIHYFDETPAAPSG